MNYLDIVIAAIVVYFLVLGVRKGIVTMFMGIAGFVLALIIATGLMGAFSHVVQDLTGMPQGFAYVFSYILLFFSVLLIVRGLTNVLVKLFTVTSTRWVDRIGGGLFGFLIGNLLVSAVLIALSFFSFTDRMLPEKENSLLYSYSRNFFPTLYDYVVKLKPSAKSFEEIVEEILDGNVLETLQKTEAGREVLKNMKRIEQLNMKNPVQGTSLLT
jgi:membrane protein required for colicin V production